MPHWVSIFCFLLVAVIKVIICETYYSEEEIKYPRLNSLENDTGFYDNNRENKSSVCGRQGRWCLPLCCQIGSFVDPYDDLCTSMENKSAPSLLPLHDVLTLELLSKQLRINDFELVYLDPCNGGESYYVDKHDGFKLLANGSIYLPYEEPSPYFKHYWEYCLAAFVDVDDDDSSYKFKMCWVDAPDDNGYSGFVSPASRTRSLINRKFMKGGLILSIPCLCVTFLVYSIVPELRNIHGSTLRAYVGSLVIVYIHMVILEFVPSKNFNPNLCKLLAYVLYLISQASFFWLNVISFDIWWTFRDLRPRWSSIKPQKQFIIYSAYAWGSSSILTGICLIMDFLPDVPSNWTKPEFGMSNCWFNTKAALGIYFYGPMGFTVVCNTCLFVSTAVKLVQHKMGTARHLEGIDSQRHDVNKQWCNLYLKLYMVMGINGSMEIASWIFEDDCPKAVWIFTDLVNALQGLIIFMIFVWKDNVKRQLLKRFSGP